MTENPTLLELTAFAGLAGALLTQLISAGAAYFTDRRKQAAEVRSQYRGKMVEIGENFFYVTGERMAAIRKNVSYWKSNTPFRTAVSMEYVKKETQRFNAYMEKLDSDNWKFNLISLYFDITYTAEDIRQDNDRSQQLYLSYLDLGNTIATAEEEVSEQVYQRFAATLVDMCEHYELIYTKLEHDMSMVKRQLLNTYSS